MTHLRRHVDDATAFVTACIILEHLLDRGLAHVEDAIALRVHEMLARVFAWDEGTYRFEEEEEVLQGKDAPGRMKMKAGAAKSKPGHDKRKVKADKAKVSKPGVTKAKAAWSIYWLQKRIMLLDLTGVTTPVIQLQSDKKLLNFI